MMPLTTWVNNPRAAMGSYYDSAGRLQWQLYYHGAMTESIESGARIVQATKSENEGAAWYREDAIVTRGYEARPGLPFVDFLVAAC